MPNKVCKHINDALNKINNLSVVVKEECSPSIIDASNFSLAKGNSSLYGYWGPYVKLETANENLNLIIKWVEEGTKPEAVRFLKEEMIDKCRLLSPLLVKKMDEESLCVKHILKIFEVLENCDCLDKIDETVKKDYVSCNDYNNLKSKYDDLFIDLKNKGDNLESAKSELERLKIKHAEEKSEQIKSESKIKEDKGKIEVELKNTKETLVETKHDLVRVQTERDQNIVKIQSLEKEKVEKESELREKIKELERKDEEIKLLKNQAGLSQEELLIEKLRFEKRNLEIFAIDLKVSLEQITNLVRYHQSLFQAQKGHKQEEIVTSENNVSQIKQELLDKEISIVNVQEICQKCERIAELHWELNKLQQQFQSQQEVIINY